MSRLPEPGDVLHAVRVLNERMVNAANVTGDDPTAFTGPMTFNLQEGTLEGEGAVQLRMVYGDLFDAGELAANGGADLVERHIHDVVIGRGGLRASLFGTLHTGVGLGVLMERHRWQGRGESLPESATAAIARALERDEGGEPLTLDERLALSALLGGQGS